MKIDSKNIERAIKALVKAKVVENGAYKKVFKGYISSFGASLAQAGLLPTIIFFEANSDQAKDRKLVIEALKSMLPEKYNVGNKKLSLFLIEESEQKGWSQQKERELLRTISDSMVAMKLALRMYREND
mgnify:CR=1 FL=1